MAIAPLFTIDKEFAKCYVEYFEKHDFSLEDYSMYVMDLEFQNNWGQVWLVLNEVVKLESKISDSALATIAAGPLETLLNEAGNEYIEQILKLAKTNNLFAKMLTGVCESEIDREVWDKVVKFCRTVKQPIDEVYGY